MLIAADQNLNSYLQSSEIIDFMHDSVQAKAVQLAKSSTNEIDIIKNIYEFVRDEIHHTFDINGDTVTWTSSDVLEHGQGVCYAKSHLLAALLRSLGIPTGFCYQKLVFSDVKPDIILHGLNAVYIKDFGKWIRLDARGNKEGVDAQFSLSIERLAFPVRKELGESDGTLIYAEPAKSVISALSTSKTIEELIDNLPTEV